MNPRSPRRPKFPVVAPDEEQAILLITELIASGEWCTGISEQEYAKLWGTTRYRVSELARMAVATARASLDPALLTSYFQEGIRVAMRNMHEADRAGERRETAVFVKIVIDAVGSLISKKEFQETKKLSAREAFTMLTQGGWEPPKTLPGLPVPDESGERYALPATVAKGAVDNDDNCDCVTEHVEHEEQ